MTWRPSLLALALGVVLAGCDAKPPTTPEPTPPVVAAPALTCPASPVVEALGATTPVSYTTPVVTGGTPPVTTSCTIPSGTAFPLGPTDVVCTARDQLNRAASCTFQVTVVSSLRLRGTKFLAFGDSITGGEVSASAFVLFNDPPNAYPTVLNQLLSQRYLAQSIEVQQCGQYGEHVRPGEDRLRNALGGGSCGPVIPFTGLGFAGPPDALLLLEGINDLNEGTSISTVINSLRADIRRAKTAGLTGIFLSTFLPQGLRGFTPNATILAANDEIRALASSEQVVLVDNFAAFAGRESTLIGADSLHPTVAGYRVMAETFFAVIVARYELPPGALATQRRPR